MWLERRFDDRGSTGLVYLLDRSRKDEFPQGVLSAQFRCFDSPASEPGNLPRLIRHSLPARLTAQIRGEKVVYKQAVSFFDEGAIKRLAEEELRQLQGPSPNFEYDARIVDPVKFTEALVRNLAESGYIWFSNCQRKPRAAIHEAEPHRPLSEQEKQLLFPYVARIIDTLEGTSLKPPFREASYYRELMVRKQTPPSSTSSP